MLTAYAPRPTRASRHRLIVHEARDYRLEVTMQDLRERIAVIDRDMDILTLKRAALARFLMELNVERYQRKARPL